MRRPDYNAFEEDPFNRPETLNFQELRIYRVALMGGPYSGKSALSRQINAETIAELTHRTNDSADVVLLVVPEAYDELQAQNKAPVNILNGCANLAEIESFQRLLVRTQLELERDAEQLLQEKVDQMMSEGGSMNREVIGVLIVDGSPTYMSFYESAEEGQPYDLSLFSRSMERYQDIYAEIFPEYQTTWRFMDWRYDMVFMLDNLLGYGHDHEFFDGRRLVTPSRAQEIQLAVQYVMSLGRTNNYYGIDYVRGNLSEKQRALHIMIEIASDLRHRVRIIKQIKGELNNQRSVSGRP